ncbi:LysR family transcriptional regulator [Ventosimonas gracilis]|uniref:LysR family transcriptional regulator n=1 Tax=Ventosimonas gracilis TaxID=1680762 RepID=A0A139SKB6_9GAMM|nr:LysR family substrate-binding domain-containing protein [Ventosimonas gracilis]KXU34976.1 LysR family transcriptional regulator [Ventosimonas gracilis]
MQDGICVSSHIRLAIAPGVPSRQLSALLALQREEEPEVAITLSEVSNDALMLGLREGRYDAGLAFSDAANASLHSQPLWREEMAIATPLRHPLLEKAALSLNDVADYPVFRWRTEICPLLEQQIACLPEKPCDIQYVTSFELMAMWVVAGYGIGITAQSRLASARAWDICMRPFADAPFEIITHLLRLNEEPTLACERFAHRALRVAKAETD